MEIKLHANATPPPRIRAYIQQSDQPVGVSARELGVHESTIRRWRSLHDHLAIGLSALEEQLVCALRGEVGLGHDDIVEVMQRCMRPELSCSAIYRCLRRYGISGYPPRTPQAPSQRFAQTAFGFIHVDLKHLPRLKVSPPASSWRSNARPALPISRSWPNATPGPSRPAWGAFSPTLATQFTPF